MREHGVILERIRKTTCDRYFLDGLYKNADKNHACGEALDQQYQHLSQLYYQIRVLYINCDDAVTHDVLLNALRQVEDQMAQISILFDGPIAVDD